jgi:hypothetical protein
MTARPESAVPTALRFLLPSARDIFFIFLFASILMGPLSNRPLADADIGWHIRAGELILQTHSVPHADPFSASMAGRPWFAWEWLYDALLGALFHIGGLNAVVWLCALIVASTFTILLRLLIDNGTGLLLAIVLTLLALGAAAIHLFARPHIVSWLFSLAWFAALDRWEASQNSAPRWLPWAFPLSMIVWVNVHGGWIFGLAMLSVFVLAAWIERLRTDDDFAVIATRQRGRALGQAFAWSALATFVNPYGWRLHWHVYQYLGNRYLMNRIDEFRSPDFHGWSERCFGVLLILLVVGFAARRSPVKLSHLFAALLVAYAGFYSSRNLPVSAMLLALIAGPILWEAFSATANSSEVWHPVRNSAAKIAAFAGRMAAQERQFRGHLWPAVTAIAAAVICVHGGWFGSRHLINSHFDEQKLPVAAVAFLDQHGDDQRGNSGPVFSTDSWGGYLIFHWYPARRVVIDDRHDFYGTDWVRAYLIMMQCEPEWRDVIAKWQIREALLPVGAPLANLLRELPQDWRVVYEDKVAVVFEKNSAPRVVP